MGCFPALPDWAACENTVHRHWFLEIDNLCAISYQSKPVNYRYFGTGVRAHGVRNTVLLTLESNASSPLFPTRSFGRVPVQYNCDVLDSAIGARKSQLSDTAPRQELYRRRT